MKIYEVEALVIVRTKVWVDDEAGKTKADIPSLLKSTLEEGEADVEYIGMPVIHDPGVVLKEELTTDELEKRTMNSIVPGGK